MRNLFENSDRWEQLALALILSASIAAISWLLKNYLYNKISKISKKTPSKWDDLFALILEKTSWVFLSTVSIYIGISSLNIPEKTAHAAHVFFYFVLFLQVGFWANISITFFVRDHIKNGKDPGQATTIAALNMLVRVIVWTTLLLLLLENYGVNVSAMVAGLGIGGIAIALAVQNILSDLLASLSIVLDKPFVIGDSIQVGEDSGTVEYIGLKTTRLKSTTGEQLIFSNSDILKSRIRNFKRMEERRVNFKIGISYETSPEKLKNVQIIIKNCIEKIHGTRFDQCFLSKFGEFSVEFDAIYFITSPDMKDYTERHHQIAISILESLKKETIELAYKKNA